MEQERSKEEDILQEQSLDKEEMNLTISCNALARIITPQTINMLGPYNTSEYPVTIAVVSLINIVVPLLSRYCYYCAP